MVRGGLGLGLPVVLPWVEGVMSDRIDAHCSPAGTTVTLDLPADCSINATEFKFLARVCQ